MNDLTIYEMPNNDEVAIKLNQINQYKAIVQKSLVKDVDFVEITGRKVLSKAGAEKLTKISNLTDNVQIIDKFEDWDKGLFYYTCKVQLITINGVVISEGIGHCNSKEDNYAWKWVYENELPNEYKGDANKDKRHSELTYREFTTKDGRVTKKYRIANDGIYSLVNTFIKMAEKRAFIDATLKACSLSDCFTQDLEDMPQIVANNVTKPTTKQTKTENQPKKDTKATNSTPNKEKIVCCTCDKEITNENVAKYSFDKYKMYLCYDCQKNFDAQNKKPTTNNDSAETIAEALNEPTNEQLNYLFEGEDK